MPIRFCRAENMHKYTKILEVVDIVAQCLSRASTPHCPINSCPTIRGTLAIRSSIARRTKPGSPVATKTSARVAPYTNVKSLLQPTPQNNIHKTANAAIFFIFLQSWLKKSIVS
jgi:hypothetical protein